MVDTLIAADYGRESRQLHVMDIKGRIAAHTGSECVDWCGHIQGDGFSLAGNMLAGAAVLDDTARAYLANTALPFAQRLIAAMKAGEAAGGDKRGKQSAALLIHGDEEWSDLDLRVDDHADPLAELDGWNRSAASAGCISASSCRRAGTRPGSPTARSSMPPSKLQWRARHDGVCPSWRAAQSAVSNHGPRWRLQPLRRGEEPLLPSERKCVHPGMRDRTG